MYIWLSCFVSLVVRARSPGNSSRCDNNMTETNYPREQQLRSVTARVIQWGTMLCKSSRLNSDGHAFCVTCKHLENPIPSFAATSAWGPNGLSPRHPWTMWALAIFSKEKLCLHFAETELNGTVYFFNEVICQRLDGHISLKVSALLQQ